MAVKHPETPSMKQQLGWDGLLTVKKMQNHVLNGVL